MGHKYENWYFMLELKSLPQKKEIAHLGINTAVRSYIKWQGLIKLFRRTT